jgi:signal transduction histidine kinase
LDTSQATAIFRILQEALTNILSHANATRITVAVELGQNNLLMTITDNGCGISPADKDKSVGFGLQGMQERARYFGGFLNISSQPGSGTTISLSLPLSG